MNYFEQFRVAPGGRIKLNEIDPGYKDEQISREQAEQEIARYQTRLLELQELLYVARKQSLLICLQAMDTGGKDGTIGHILAAMNPQGCRVVSFKQPTEKEAAHDFLWRIHQAAPARGEVVVFNRSHYEDVLVVRVHDLVPQDIWEGRYEQINSFEKHLAANGTLVLKFFLHISKDEQLARFKKRLDEPSKQWKISDSDYREREFWDQYMQAYEDALARCSTESAPWFVIPANHKWFRNLAVARIVVEQLEQLKLTYPAPSVDLDRIRKEYEAAAKQ